jgi:hypothetical protein
MKPVVEKLSIDDMVALSGDAAASRGACRRTESGVGHFETKSDAHRLVSSSYKS